MPETVKIISPVDGSVYAERPIASDAEIASAISSARGALPAWRNVPVAERGRYMLAFLDALVAMNDDIAVELAWQMGRPVRYGGEKGAAEERVRAMVALAEEALKPYTPPAKDGFRRYIAREPVGIVMVIAPWNYPYLTAINTIVPGLLAGNAIILKHAAQTLLVGERIAEAFRRAGLPKGLFHNLVMSHEQTEKLIGSGKIDHINFTGSVAGGRAIERATAGTFASIGLELGGKDPAYVRADAKLDHAIENLVDGAFYNSGQCCCGVERIYVDARVYDDFVEGFADLTRKYVVGNPLDQSTTLGPMARASFADTVRGQTAEALRKGATALINMKVEGDRPGLALSRAGGADQRQSPDGGDARGELRARGRHHEGARRRGGDHADERQSLWTDGLDLDARHRPRRRDRRTRRDRHGLHEPLRLSRSAAHLDRRQGHGPRFGTV